ncbi:B3 domain-containing protein REM21-like [Silene latifolia]|uniref:B3 domain-containing protein REM21-like n=1 Tax=Silene latifolia TaxID=37657 RepID=UPI003D781700
MGSSDVKYPEFFNVFLPHLCSTNVKIPNAFVENISKKIPKKVVLKSRSGKLWAVALGEMEDGLYMQEGWSRFVMDNKLEAGDFVVFKYNGHHVFDVIIFGLSGCEKEQEGSSVKEKMADEKVKANKRGKDNRNASDGERAVVKRKVNKSRNYEKQQQGGMGLV